MSLYKVTTVNGHLLPEVVSALQKCIRRGQVDDALYWAVDMYLTGYDEYAWKRLRIIASEDVGPAEPNLPATIEALYHTYTDLKKKKDEAHAPQRLQFVHAVILLATARKNRIVDHAADPSLRQPRYAQAGHPGLRSGQAHRTRQTDGPRGRAFLRRGDQVGEYERRGPLSRAGPADANDRSRHSTGRRRHREPAILARVQSGCAMALPAIEALRCFGPECARPLLMSTSEWSVPARTAGQGTDAASVQIHSECRS